MPLPFNKNLDLKLLKLVKDNPILYNTKHPKYLDFDSREVVWQKIGDSISRPATEFAGIQCQINFGDFQEEKHKPGFLENLKEYLPENYLNAWGIEKKILKAYSTHVGVSELDAKCLYIKTARALPTYGVTFFLVKEKQKDKKKLVPRLLGINAEAILRLDENTKEILQQWPLTHVKTYHAGKSQTFTLNFGDYSDKEYSVKTQDAYRIRDILEGYIDIIRRRMLAKPTSDAAESMAVCHDNVQAGKSHLIEHVSNNPSKIVSETFVGPTRIVPFDQGSQPQQGTQIMTAQQIIITDHLQNQQHALKGEVPMRGDMSMDCAKKLNRMNSSSVKIVTLLTDPTEENVKEVQKIVESMQQDFPDVERGIKETAEKQTVDEARKILFDELQDLQDYMKTLAEATKPGQINRDEAKEAAENIADLTTQIYFSMDPTTRRRSGFLRVSRQSFKAGERKEQNTRRESFATAANTAIHAVDNAALELHREYNGPKIDETHRKRLEKALEEKMGKLNAAIALYLTAHSDPDNIDYAAAINSMNDINELMPELARDAQALASTKDAEGRKELLDDMKTLFDATKKICGITSTEDHEKMQEASNKYADVAGKLIFTFARGTNADKENEIIDLAKEAGDKTSILLVKANELTCQAPSEAAAHHVDDAGVKTVQAARDLLACAQLTAPAIHEPHCQSALRAAAEGLSSSVHQLEGRCRPLLDHPTTAHMKAPLHAAANHVHKALNRLNDAYGHLGASDGAEDPSVPLRERQRLKFIASMAGVKNNPLQVNDIWNKSATGRPSQEEKAAAQRRLEQQMAQLNAAVAALAAATADRKNPDYVTAELAINTISELMPQIVKDTEIVSSDKDEATRAAMLKQVQALCEATKDMCDGTGYQHAQGEDAAKFAAASGKLVFLISPGADKAKEKQVMQLSSSICDKSADMLSQAHRMKEQLGPDEAQLLDEKMARLADMAKALNAVTQLSASSVSEPRCQSTLLTSAERLREAADQLAATCRSHVPDEQQVKQLMTTKQQLDDGLNKLVFTCGMPDGKPNMIEELKQKQRLKFVRSLSSANRHLQSADELLNKPIEPPISMAPDDKAALEQKLAQELAALNAGVANLLAATADRENPNYAAANRAIETISDWLPLVVQDGAALTGTKDEADQAKMLQNIRDLCEATRAVCQVSAQPEGLLQGDVVANYTTASNNLMPLVGSNVDNAQKDKIINLTAEACGKTGELLAKVSSTLDNEDPEYAQLVDSKGANTADAAKLLLTIAQLTSPTISEAVSSAALTSAAEDLEKSVKDLTSSCKRPVQEQVKGTAKELEDCIKQLLLACKEKPPRSEELRKPAVGQKPAQPKKPAVPTRPAAPMKSDDSAHDKEQQRLKMISSVSAAKERLDNAEQLLNEPTICQLMSEEDGEALERRLAQRLAQLNAAVAALGIANADRENPDYVAAEKALASISDLIPQIVQDSRKLCGTKDSPTQQAMIKDLKALCEATREVCDNALQPQGSSDAAAKFSAASGNFFYQVSPQTNNELEKQVIELTAGACGKASELLSQVHSLTELVKDPAAAGVLDTHGANTADAAQTLLSVAQVTAPSITDPSCASTLMAAADKLRNNAVKLTAACQPHQQAQPELSQRLERAQQELNDSLNKLVQACKMAQRGSMVSLSPQQEKERTKFVSSIAGIKPSLDNTEKQLLQPVLCQMMSEEDGVKLQHQLSRQLAQLNAAVAALAAATCDGKNPDYPAAERAVTTINEMMPKIIQDFRKLCGSTADQAEQAAILHNLKTLCDATKDICNSNGQPKKLHQASAKLADASGKLVFIVSPGQKTQRKRSIDDGKDVVLSPQQEKERAKFVNSIAGVKQSLDNTEQQLKQPVLCQMMSEEDGVKLQHQLSRQLAQLNAALDALRTATSDSKNPDYPAAEKAVKTINDMIPKIVQDSRKLCGSTADQAEQAAILHDLKTLCDATKDIFNSNGQPKKLHQASAKLADASGKLTFIVSPGQKTQQKRNIDDGKDMALSPQQEKERAKFVSTVAGVKQCLDNTEQQLKQPVLCQMMSEEDGVKLQHQLSRQLAQLNAAIDALRTATSDSKIPDYPAAEKAVKTINDMIPKIVQDSRKLCGLTADQAEQAAILHNLKTLCDATKDICNSNGQPKKLQQASAKLADASGKLVFIVSPGQKTQQKRYIDDAKDVVLTPQQEKECAKFVNSIAGVKQSLDNTEQQLKQPVLCQMMSEEDGVKLQHQLSRQLAQLNAAIDALRNATSDSKNPDYPAAEKAVNTINDMIPKIVQDSRKLCGSSADQGEQTAILKNLKTLCDATRDICDSNGQPKKLHQASAKLADASGKLTYIVSPGQKTIRKRSVDDMQESPLSPQQEKERAKFVSCIASVKPILDSTEKQLMQPVPCQMMTEEDNANLQNQLARQLAQLNAAIAALSAATRDNKNPDYPAAERAVTTINDMIPKIVQDSRKLCGSSADQAEQAAILQNLKTLCDATRDICDSNGRPKKLHQASAKLADASSKLTFIVSPGQKTQQKHVVDAAQGPKPSVLSKKPAVPSRDVKPRTVAHAAPSTRKSVEITHDFLERLRCEESQDMKARVVSVSTKPMRTDDEKCAQNRYTAIIDDAEKEISEAQEKLKVLYNADSVHVAGSGLSPVELAEKEQHMEDTLAKAGVEVAALVGANYADKLDYKAAAEPTTGLIQSVKSIVDDGTLVCGALPEETCRPFITDMMGLCDALKDICHAAKSDKEKLNNAAISFGDQSTKLLRVVSSDVNPALEKELISRAKAIGDSASRLALEAGKVASNSEPAGDGRVQDICTAGTKCVDCAGKLVYTAKLVAPTIHHSTCQDFIVSSADNLSTSLKSFANTWQPLSSTQQPSVHKLTEEANNLEKLVEKLRNDVKLGKMYGKRKSVMVDINTPLRQMTLQVIENANNISEHGQLSPELKKQYSEYSGRLAEALRALDLANARCQRAPRDRVKRNQMELAIQDLQMTLLQSRPSRSGQELNNIVDFRDFLQDLEKESKELQDTATKHQGPVGKRATDDIKLLCSKISEDAHKLLHPSEQRDDVMVMNSVDDILDINQFGQECDAMIKEINSTISKIQDQKAKQALRAKVLPLCESCNLLRFAVNSHISATKAVAYEEALQDLDNFQTNVMKPLVSDVINNKKERKIQVTPLGSRGCCRRVTDDILLESKRAVSGEPQQLVRTVAKYAAKMAHSAPVELLQEETITTHLSYVVNQVAQVTNSSNVDCINWGSPKKLLCTQEVYEDFNNEALETILDEKPVVQVLNKDDIDLLIRCERVPVEGSPMQLEDKVQELSTKLSSLSGTIVQSVKNPESLCRTARGAAQTASHLANTARALARHKKPGQSNKIEESAREMCLATYSLLKTSEFVCQEPNHHDSRRKMLDALHHLNDCINKLVRSVNSSEKVPQVCGEAQRSLQLQRSILQGTPQPCGPLPYSHTVDTVHGQRDVLQKLNSDQKMSRAEFMKNLLFITSAVNNTAECAAQATYLLSVSDKDESIGKDGICDVSKLHKAVGAVQDTCVSVLMARDNEQIAEEVKTLDSQVQELVTSLDEEVKKVKDPQLKEALEECSKEIQFSVKNLCTDVQKGKPKEQISSSVCSLMDDVNYLGNLLEHSDLVPTVGQVSKETKAECDDIVKKSLALVTNTEELIKQVKSAPEQDEMMTWVMFNKRKDVLDAFDALLNSIKSSGQRKKFVENTDDLEDEQKQSYVQKQFDAASKWLSKSMCKPQVKANGQEAVKNLMDVANKLTEDLKDAEKEDMRNLIMETEQLLKECSKKYDQEQYSVLLERARELKKCIERVVVTRVVEQFMETEEPLQDLEILADAERDEKTRKFLLEKKIAELLAHLSRVSKTARLIAHTDTDDKNSEKLNSCTQQAELLAPMLVKAAQERIARPDDKAVIENYKSLLAKYAESLSKIRDLCDQSVDPMDFVQTAGETMQRMREESTKHNEPMKCAQTSAAITKLASRVIHVGMSSRAGRTDPDLHHALTQAHHQLTAATTTPDTRASRMPDWEDTTAKILQTTEEVEALIGGETIFKKQPEPNQPIYKGALDLHVAIRDWSSRDNEIVAVAKRMAVLMAKLSNFMNNDKQREVLSTSKSIVSESQEVARLANKLAHECTDYRIKTNLLQACERIPTISGQLKMLTTVKGFSLGRHGTQEDIEAMDMLVGNAQSLMLSIQDVVKGAASASVKISAQRGLRMKWVRKNTYSK